MTDVLPRVNQHDALDEEIVSQNEHAPKAPKEPTISAGASSCAYCAETFEGPARYFTKGRHEKAAHFDEWQKNRDNPKAAKAKKAPAAKKTTRTTVTGPKDKRIPAGESISRNLVRVAKLFGRVDPVVGRAVTFSAPATGQAVDDLVAGTFIDKMAIQRFAGAADKWEKFGGIIAFPILIALVSRNPDLFTVLEDDLRDATLDVIIASIGSLEKQKAKEDKAISALARLGRVDERYAQTDDPIGLILRDIFNPPEKEETNGGAA
jgi:hypothetical protein